MAISITWGTKVIYIPQSYLTLVSGSLYSLDVDQFRLDLKNLEDSEEGMAFPDTHRHNTEVTVSGLTLARVVEIINGYTVEFEDGTYSVRCEGANHNISDVKVVNQVSLIIGNSAGLVKHPVDEVMRRVLINKQITDPSTGKLYVYDDDDVTVYAQADLYEDVSGVQPYRGQGAERRDRIA